MVWLWTSSACPRISSRTGVSGRYLGGARVTENPSAAGSQRSRRCRQTWWPNWLSTGSPSSTGGFLMNSENTFSGISEVTNTNAADPDNCYKLGHTNISESVTTNRWTLVKIHVDTSSPSARYEAWMRPLGGSWIKTAEWISGVTPGFTWTVSPAHVGGHRTFRMPSTMGRASGSGYDSWHYMTLQLPITKPRFPQYLDEPARVP